jgi:hypothetical protein
MYCVSYLVPLYSNQQMLQCLWILSAYRSCCQPTVKLLEDHEDPLQMSLSHPRVCEASLGRGQSGNLMGDGANLQHAIDFVAGYDD